MKKTETATTTIDYDPLLSNRKYVAALVDAAMESDYPLLRSMAIDAGAEIQQAEADDNSALQHLQSLIDEIDFAHANGILIHPNSDAVASARELLNSKRSPSGETI